MDVYQAVQTGTTICFDINNVIRESFGAAGFPVPEQHLAIRNHAASAVNA